MTPPEAIRRQLEIPRERAAALGREGVAIVDSGQYVVRSGRRISIGARIAAARVATVEYAPDETVPTSADDASTPTRIDVCNETTLAAARRLLEAGHEPAALNFASATSPGGGFLDGSRAQEEYLARSSGLYACLRDRRMYTQHRGWKDPFYDDFVIYSPGVPVFRDDDGLLLEDPWSCAILTCPAVHARAVRKYVPARVGEIEGVMRRRIDRVLTVAAGHRRRALVLGAWGCGAFGNDPEMVARLFQDALSTKFARSFATIVFAVADWSSERLFIAPFERRFRSVAS